MATKTIKTVHIQDVQAHESPKSYRPLLSVGLPVFNGERYLKESIDSILGQSFKEFELVICDNASTDRTEEICRGYARQDPRVHYYRNDRNIGGANNGNRTFVLSSGKYFRLAAYDDICAPELFAKCLDVLESDPTVALSYSMFVEIDAHGNPLKTISRNKGSSTKPHVRFRNLTSHDYTCEEMYAFMRSDVLGRTRLLQNYTDSDRTLLCELGLRGRFHEVPECLFYRRIHAEMSTRVYADWRGRMRWFDPEMKNSFVFPHWLQFIDYLRTIGRVPLPWSERARCYAFMGKWLLVHGKGLVKDVLVAAHSLFQ